MARGINKVILVGNLGADPEVRYTSGGSAVANVRLATAESWKDRNTGEQFWISGCRKDGNDALYNTDVKIDPDVRREYWVEIREQPENVDVTHFRARGKYGS